MKKLLPALLVLAVCGASAAVKDKVYRYMPLKKDLSVIQPDGSRNIDVSFRRYSEAVTPDFKKYGVDEPRFWKGGLLIEPGGNTSDRGTINLLTRKGDPFDKSGASVQNEQGMTKSAFKFSGKIVLKPVKFDITKKTLSTNHIFSFYAKGSGTLTLTPSAVLIDGKNKSFPVQKFQLTNEWKRYHLQINGGVFRTKKDVVKTFSTVLEGNNVSIDAAMLETPCSYFAVQSPTTYVPNGLYRMPDTLRFPELPAGISQEGAFAFNMELMGHGGWQSILTVGAGHWAKDNDLEINYSRAYGGFLKVDVFRGAKTLNVKLPFKLGDKYHVIFSYDKTSYSVYINGKKAASAKAPWKPFRKPNLFLGGRAMQVYSNMVYSNFTIFNKSLTDAEAAELAKNPDLEGKLSAPSKLSLRSSQYVFPTNSGKAVVRFRTSETVKNAKAKIGNYSIVDVKNTGNGELVCSFDTALLMPGKYKMDLSCEYADGSREVFPFALEISNALRPKEHFQINSWNVNGKTFSSYGVTMGSGGYDPLGMNDAARYGTYATFNLAYQGTPRLGYESEDYAISYKGSYMYPNPRSAHIQQDMINKGKTLASLMKDSPVFLGLNLNSERHQGSHGLAPFDFSPAEIKRAEKFGLDLNRWKPSGKYANKAWYYFHPNGNLSVNPVPEMRPADGAVPENDPLYNYHVERHGATGGTDVYLNDLVAKEVLRVRPDIIVTQDPILRRPSLRSYREINNAADWCYYTEPSRIVLLTERLGATVRGFPHMTATAMPQFLFKSGTAAPYNACPPVDLFRGATLLTLSRPIRVIAYWSAPQMFSRKNHQYPAEIAKLTGNKDWKETAKIIKEKKLKLFSMDPGIPAEFKRISDTYWYPFGALFPKWKNAPRRIAVSRSFASDLYGNIHWAGVHDMELASAVSSLGIPYDILYDEDLSKDLSRYDMVFLPSAHALPAKAIANLLEYKKKGGVIVVDEKCKIKAFSDVIRLSQVKNADKEFKKQVEELYKRANGNIATPLYVEGIQVLVEKQASQTRYPGLPQLLKKYHKSVFEANKSAIFWNHLQADGADYLFAVNDLRVYGPDFGRFKAIREKGVPQTVDFTVRNPAFKYAYDMISSKQIPFRNGKIRLELGPCDGKIILFTGKPIGKLSASAAGTAVPGKNITVKIRLENSTGLIPVLLDVYDAAGKKLSISRSSLLKNGVLDHIITIPVNAPAGRWKLVAKELARGQVRTVSFDVK